MVDVVFCISDVSHNNCSVIQACDVGSTTNFQPWHHCYFAKKGTIHSQCRSWSEFDLLIMHKARMFRANFTLLAAKAVASKRTICIQFVRGNTSIGP